MQTIGDADEEWAFVGRLLCAAEGCSTGGGASGALSMRGVQHVWVTPHIRPPTHAYACAHVHVHVW
eukprot:7382036-Prymnesium_polylepis.1